MFLSSPSTPGALPCPKRGKMPKKMRLEYEYDVQTAAVAVTQLEPCGSRGPSRLPDLPSSPALSHQPLGEPLPTAAACEAPPEQTLCHLQQPSTQSYGHRSLWHRWVLEGKPLPKEGDWHESSHACSGSQPTALVWPHIHGKKQGRHVHHGGEQGGVTGERNCPSEEQGLCPRDTALLGPWVLWEGGTRVTQGSFPRGSLPRSSVLWCRSPREIPGKAAKSTSS